MLGNVLFFTRVLMCTLTQYNSYILLAAVSTQSHKCMDKKKCTMYIRVPQFENLCNLRIYAISLESRKKLFVRFLFAMNKIKCRRMQLYI